MSDSSHNQKPPEKISILEARILSELVAYAKRLGETSLTFFFSPVLEIIEGIHYGGRKTFRGRISLAVFRQWEQRGLIHLVRPDDKALKSRGSPSAVLAFVIPEDVLRDPTLRDQHGISATINHLFHQVFP
jgi:hypothetical protein